MLVPAWKTLVSANTKVGFSNQKECQEDREVNVEGSCESDLERDEKDTREELSRAGCEQDFGTRKRNSEADSMK